MVTPWQEVSPPACSSLTPVMGTPLRLMPSPLRPLNAHGMSTPSPVRLGPSSFFSTPGMLAGTPVTEAMAISSWLQDLVKAIPAEVCVPCTCQSRK